MKILVSTYELDPIELPEGEPLRFRVEIFSDQAASLCSARVLRWESMRLIPSFEDRVNVGGSDYNLLVEDDSLGVQDICGDSPEKVLQAVLVRISETVGRG
ncbi:MAG TPA: hypothetical protein PKZ76_10060 [Xanthomonadaceae bacterium]|nr:hypothetical protein [Xanthomonadaceae bacterium]